MEAALKNTECEIVVAYNDIHTTIREYLRRYPGKKTMLGNAWRANSSGEAGHFRS